MEYKVTYARLHEGVFLPGKLGTVGSVFPSQTKTIPDLDMTYTAHGLFITALGENIVIPLANVIVCRYVKVNVEKAA